MSPRLSPLNYLPNSAYVLSHDFYSQNCLASLQAVFIVGVLAKSISDSRQLSPPPGRCSPQYLIHWFMMLMVFRSAMSSKNSIPNRER